MRVRIGWSYVLSAAVLAGVALTCVAGPAGAAVPPTTSVTLSPSTPSGVPPWYVSSPEVFLASSQTGTVYYMWTDGVLRQRAVTTDTPLSIGFAPDGSELLTAFSVSAAGTETPPVTRAVYTDSQPPGRPQALTGVASDAGLDLTWEGVTDTGDAGVSGYFVYRSDDEALFDTGDRIGFTGGTDFSEPADSPGVGWWYAVSGRDSAGNEGFLSDAVRIARADRLAGTDRYATAIAASEESFADGSAPTVVLASGSDYPDALCASGLAGAVDCPILLLPDDSLGPELREELARLGVVDAYVVGGPAVVSEGVLLRLEAVLSGSVTRLFGPNRYATAAAVADEIALLSGPRDRAFVASGVAFADALSAAPAAYRGAEPILFATPDAVPAETLSALEGLGVTSSVLVGGGAAVTLQAESLIPSPTRVSGPDRYATSRAFADWASTDGSLDGSTLLLATGATYPDGLVAGPLGGRANGPVVLTATSDVSELSAWLSVDPLRFVRAYVLGGQGALGPAVDAAVAEALSIE